MVMAMVIPAVLAMVGLALDLGNLYSAHTRLQAAVDSAALAGSLELPYDPDLDKGLVRAAATGMLEKNYPGSELDSLIPGTMIRSVNVQAHADVDLLILGFLGLSAQRVEAAASAGFNKLEVVFVIDNSGSMKGTPINMVKQAAGELVDLIIPDGSETDTKIGLVPFRGKVNVGEAAGDGLSGCRNADGSLNQGIHEDFMDLYWDLPYYYRRRVNLDTCSSIPEAQELTRNKSAVIASLNSQTATGAASGTVIPEGLKWGRHMLTPQRPYDQAGDKEEFRKIIILLTDGDNEDGNCGGPYRAYYEPNNYWTNAYYGMKVTDAHCEDGGRLNQDMLNEAEAAKDAGIEIFTIRFGTSDNTDRDLMRAMASSKPGTDDHYFDAPSVYDIDDIFKKIGRQLGWRLLS
jgi:uncharacterized protein YegL